MQIFTSRKTAAALASFMAISSSMLLAGCISDDDMDLSTVYDDQVLKDDSGREYTLRSNGDGTETATYGNGENVTFRRDEDGNLNVISGAAGLLGGLAAGYFLFHGLNNSSGGHYDSCTNRYVPAARPYKITETERTKKAAQFVPAGKTLNTTKPNVINNSNGGNKSVTNSSPAPAANNSTAKSVSESSKGGFGSAGARGGVS